MRVLIADLITYAVGAFMLSACHVLAWRIWVLRPHRSLDGQEKWRRTSEIQVERGWPT